MIDEINKKAIDEIIRYYDTKQEEETIPETPEIPESTPSASEEDPPRDEAPISDEVFARDEAPVPDKTLSRDEAPSLVDLISGGAGKDIFEDSTSYEEEIDVPIQEYENPEDNSDTLEEVSFEEDETAEIPEEFSPPEEDAKEDEAEEDESSKKAEVIDLADYMPPAKSVPKDKTKRKKIIKISIAAVLVCAFVAAMITVDTGIIGAYKRNFAKNAASILSFLGIDLSKEEVEEPKQDSNVKEAKKYKTNIDGTTVYSFEKAGSSVFSAWKSGIVCANTNFLAFINGDGEKIWENTTTIVNPILDTDGNYILIGEKNGTKLCLYNDKRLVYEIDTESPILSCTLSSAGDAVVIANKSTYKGAVMVYNKEGNQVFSWASGSDSIISADISPVTRHVAVSLMNTDEQVKSTLLFFNMKETESYAKAIFEDTILFDVYFTGDTLNAFGDNCIAGLSSKGSLHYDYRFDGLDVIHYGADERGNKIILFDDENIPLMNVYGSGAKLKCQLSADEIPDFVDICGNKIVYNSGRRIICGKAGSRRMTEFTASMDIKKLMLLDKNTFAIVYSNSIEIVRM